MFISRVLPSFFPVKPIKILGYGSSNRQPGKCVLTIDSIDILLEDRSVPFALHLSKSHIDVDLLFCGCD